MIRVALLMSLLALSGCGNGPLLRDDYFGRSWLEPDRTPTRIERDGYGNPILPPTRETDSAPAAEQDPDSEEPS